VVGRGPLKQPVDRIWIRLPPRMGTRLRDPDYLQTLWNLTEQYWPTPVQPLGFMGLRELNTEAHCGILGGRKPTTGLVTLAELYLRFRKPIPFCGIDWDSPSGSRYWNGKRRHGGHCRDVEREVLQWLEVHKWATRIA